MIVECPGCMSHYDVSGRPPGTRARCQCGTIFELPELPTPTGQAAMLDCPRCGGDVAATNHACEFCGVELLVMACPRCFARMFRGSKFCTQCATPVIAPANAEPDGQARRRVCPRCTDAILIARMVGDVLLDDCPTCLGTFVDVNALERIVSERRPTESQALLHALAPQPGSGPGRDTVSGGYPVVSVGETGSLYVECPDCDQMMNRRRFAQGVPVIVDVCRDHGTWFDKDELAQVIEYAARGQLAASETKGRVDGSGATAEQPIIYMEAPRRRSLTERVATFSDLIRALGGYLTR